MEGPRLGRLPQNAGQSEERGLTRSTRCRQLRKPKAGHAKGELGSLTGPVRGWTTAADGKSYRHLVVRESAARLNENRDRRLLLSRALSHRASNDRRPQCLKDCSLRVPPASRAMKHVCSADEWLVEVMRRQRHTADRVMDHPVSRKHRVNVSDCTT